VKALDSQISDVLFLLFDRIGQQCAERPPRHVAEMLRYAQRELSDLRFHYRPHNCLSLGNR
jgi:hypothetical protein